jgi:DNA-binding GntR family transcriptional regulator
MLQDRPFTTKTEWVYDRLRGRILDGELKPDDRLRLSALAREFQTSEMPVREALRMLQRDGLIQIESHRGATVVNLSFERAAEIVAVRMHLEILATREAAGRHSAKSLEEIERLLTRMDGFAAARQAGRFSTGNREFHTRLYAPAPNATLEQEIQDLWDRVWRARSKSIFELDEARMEAAQREHWAVFEGVRRGDAEAAAAAMARHREATVASWRRIVASTTASEA